MNYKIGELQRIVENQGEIILQLLSENEECMLVEENLEARIRLLENENGFLEKENEELRCKILRLEQYISFLEDMD